MIENLNKIIRLMYPLGDNRLLMPYQTIRQNLELLILVSFENRIPKRWKKFLGILSKTEDRYIEKLVWDLYLSLEGLGTLQGFGLSSRAGSQLAGDPERVSIVCLN